MAQVVAFAFGLAASSFFPVIIMGMFWKRATKEGAMAGMVTGIVFTAAYIIYFKFMNPALNTAEHWWWGISPEGIGTIGMILNFVVLIGVSLVTKAPPKEVQDLVAQPPLPEGVGPPGRGSDGEGGRALAHALASQPPSPSGAAVLRGGRPVSLRRGVPSSLPAASAARSEARYARAARAASRFSRRKPTNPAALPMTRICVAKFATSHRSARYTCPPIVAA